MMLINNRQHYDGIRAKVNHHLGDLGAQQEDLALLAESVLHDGDEQVAVRFRAGRFIAIWNVPDQSIRFYDNNASNLRTVTAK